MRRFRVAQIGTGRRGQSTLSAYARHPERVEVVAICNRGEENRRKAAETYNIRDQYSTVEELIDHCDFEVASVSTATPVRKSVIIPLLEAGKAVITDKPFAETLEEAREIVACAERVGQRVAVGQNFRYHAGFDAARQYLRTGKLGTPRHLTHVSLYTRQDKGWRIERDRLVMAVMSIHWFDGYRWMLDDEPETIYCQTSNSKLIKAEGETHTSIIIRFKSGCIACLTEGFGSHTRFSLGPVLDCDNGSLEISFSRPLGAELRVYTVGSEKPTKIVKNGILDDESTYLVLDDLLKAIENNAETPNSGRDNLLTMGMMEAAYLSAKENRAVDWEEMGV